MEYITVKQTAAKRNCPVWQILASCETGRVPGAVQKSGRWFLPADTDPACLASAPAADGIRILPPGTGLAAHIGLPANIWYVDKTLMALDLIQKGGGNYLFIRPRCFGKSAALRMLRTFFERTEKDTSALFGGTNVREHDIMFRAHQGKYPVIYLDFSTIHCTSWDETCRSLTACLNQEIQRHREVLDSGKCSEFARKRLLKLISGNADVSDYKGALLRLSQLLLKHYGKPAIIMADGYDEPVLQGALHGFYKEASDFIYTLLAEGLKDNNSIKFGFLTSAYEPEGNLLYWTNALPYDARNRQFSTCFGFTEDEVQKMAALCRAEDKMDEIRARYGGYRFGDTELFSPRSVFCCLEHGMAAAPYCPQDKAELGILRNLISKAGQYTCQELRELLRGNSATAEICSPLEYSSRLDGSNDRAVFQLLYGAGLLTASDISNSGPGYFSASLVIPNKEAEEIFQEELAPFIPAH